MELDSVMTLTWEGKVQRPAVNQVSRSHTPQVIQAQRVRQVHQGSLDLRARLVRQGLQALEERSEYLQNCFWFRQIVTHYQNNLEL